jgi:hypothetical protein
MGADHETGPGEVPWPGLQSSSERALAASAEEEPEGMAWVELHVIFSGQQTMPMWVNLAQATRITFLRPTPDAALTGAVIAFQGNDSCVTQDANDLLILQNFLAAQDL